MDTPIVPPPQCKFEQGVLDRLSVIRDKLLLLKRDRTTYIRSQDVIPLYDETMEEVKELNNIRARTGNKEENRVDKIMESCFQLLSLFYLTIGRKNEAPAAYALTSTIKRLLDHLDEVKLYSAKDLESISKTLGDLCASLNNSTGTVDHPHLEYLLTLVKNRVERCKETTARLQKSLDRFSPCLLCKHEKIISLLRCISYANTKPKFSSTEVQKLRNQLLEVGELRTNGKFCAGDGTVPPGSEEVSDMYSRCLKWSEIVLDRKGNVEPQWRPIYDVLVGIRNDLEKLSMTQAWSLRETDLYDFQRQLDKIDESRVGGNFFDDRGRPADLWMQRTLLYLIRRSYAYIYQLMIGSEPVSEALLPIYNQLQTLKRCLREVKENGGVSSVRELYPYSMKLNSIDNMRKDGKFVVNGDIPEGQGNVSELLAECFDINYELRVAAEESANNTPKDTTNGATQAAADGVVNVQ